MTSKNSHKKRARPSSVPQWWELWLKYTLLGWTVLHDPVMLLLQYWLGLK